MDGFFKFLKTLLLIPVIEWIVLLVFVSLTVPLFVARVTAKLYKEKLSQKWVTGTYTAASIGEILLIASICARKKQDNTGK